MENNNNENTQSSSRHIHSSVTEHHHHHHHHHHSYEERQARKRREAKKEFQKKLLMWLALSLAVVAGLVIAIALYRPGMLQRFASSDGVTPAAGTSTHKPLDYNGIDVSHHQELINWQQVAYDANIKFAYIKATEGGSIVDKQYAHNAAGATKAKVPFGSYHYFTSHSTVREQFDNFSSTAQRVDQVLKPMVKIEEDGVRGWSKEQIQNNLAEMIKLVSAFYHCQPLIGCSTTFYNEYLAGRFDRFQLFLTEYDENQPLVDGAGGHDIWQQPNESPIKGINTPVHLDAFSEGTTIDDLYISNIKEH